MSAKRRDDAPDADEQEHDEEAALDIEAAVECAQQAIAREEAGNERLEKYPELIWSLSDLIHPAAAENAEHIPRKRLRRLDPLLRNEVELALRAIARDVRRIATAPGPRCPVEPRP